MALTSTPGTPSGSSADSSGHSAMHVPLLDLCPQFQALRGPILEAVTAVLDSQQMINGPAVAAFEQAVAALYGIKAAVGVSSGSDALLAVLMALEIGPGDQVILPSFTFFATAGAVARVGATPVFVDIDPETFNVDVQQVAAAVTPRTKAVMPVHLFGQMADMTPLMAMAERHGLVVIEDAAQAIGASQRGTFAGAIGTAGCFSFFPSKNLGGAGDGGMITTQNEALADKLRSLRNHGMQPKYYHSMIGGNFRLDTIQAAYLHVKLPHLETWAKRRAANAAKYDHLLTDLDEVITPKIAAENQSIYNQYVIRAKNRDGLKAHLAAHRIGCEIYYPLGLHEQACFAYLDYRRGDLPETERAADEVLALPIYPELSDEQIRYVAKTVRGFYEGT